MIEPLESIDQLRQLQSKLSKQAGHDIQIHVCSTGCRALGALNVCDALEKAIAHRRLTQRVRVIRAGCLGLCQITCMLL